jgi:subtilisin family serine protease
MRLSRICHSSRRWIPRAAAVVLAALVMLAAPAIATDKPTPPTPPNPPQNPPHAPAPPGQTVPAAVTGVSGSQTQDAATAQGPLAAVDFGDAGRTPVVQPGEPLRGRVLVTVAAPAEVVVSWKVDGLPVGRIQARLETGAHTLTSPALPTQRPGRFIVEADIDGTPALGTSYTVLGDPGPDRSADEIAAIIRGTPRDAEVLAGTLGLLLVQAWQLQSVPETLATYRVGAAADFGGALGALRAHPMVKSAEAVSFYDTHAGPSLQALQYAPQILEIPAAHRWARGRGVRVAVIDTGVDPRHPDVAQTLEASEDLTGGGYAAEAHGTAVAGIIAATRNLTGTAPGARVYSLRACVAVRAGGLDARCRSDALIRAFDRAIALRADIINASLGGPVDPLLRQAVERALAAGIVVVAASGNDGPREVVRYPAAIPGVITVGATDARDRLYPRSTPGRFVFVSAPGAEILTTMPGGRHLFVSGTSMAAAHVSGVIALLMEVSRARAEEVSAALRQTATDLGSPGYDPQFGHGRISACRPLAAVLPRASCP